MSIYHKRRLQAVFTLGGNSFECQISDYTVDPGVQDGERIYTLCPDGVSIEDTDNEPTLRVMFYEDFRSGGISDYLYLNSGARQAAELRINPDRADEYVGFSGTVIVRPYPVGGVARETQTGEVTFQVVDDDYTYTRY